MISFLFAKTEENDPASQALLIHLYADHYGLWVSKLNSFSGIDDANDIIQYTFVAMLSKTELLKTLPEAKQIAYITKSLLNRARRVYSNRSRYKVTDEIETGLADRSFDPALLFDKKATAEAFRRALERLSDRDRELLLDKYFEDLPDAAIADLVGLKPASIRSALTRARRALKKELDKELEDA